jgi:hypothetical protein
MRQECLAASTREGVCNVVSTTAPPTGGTSLWPASPSPCRTARLSFVLLHKGLDEVSDGDDTLQSLGRTYHW